MTRTSSTGNAMRAGLGVGACRRGVGFPLPGIKRSALFASAAAGALLLAAQNPVRAQAVPPFTPPSPCAVSGVSPNKTVTCTGNVSTGVVVSNTGGLTGYTAIKIPGLTNNITGGASVIGLTSTTSAYVLVNAGSYSITSVGKGSAIKAAANTGAAVIVSSSAAGIFAQGGGISAASQKSSVSVTSTGNITSSLSIAIEVDAKTAATVKSAGALSGANGMTVNGDSIYIKNVGNITATASQGILATGQKGEVKVISDGEIKSVTHGLRVRSGSGDIVVETTGSIVSQNSFGIFSYTSTGDIGIKADAGSITSYRAGIYANTSNSGAGNIVISGSVDILAQGKDVSQVRYAANGITAYTVDSANIMIDVTGNISSNHARGIYALSYYGAEISIKTGGNFSGAKQGVYAVSTHDAEINVDSSGGSITSLGDSAIYARNHGASAVTVTGAANIYAVSTANSSAHGIDARSATGGVTVDVSGNVTSVSGRGIAAQSGGPGSVNVTSAGTVAASLEGIAAVGGSGAVTVSAEGDVSSSMNSAIVVEGLGNLSVTAEGLTVGAAGYAGVEFGDDVNAALGGLSNALNIAGEGDVRNAGTLADLAIRGRTGSEAVVNSGAVTGSVDLGAGVNSFLNAEGGVFVTGNTLKLGAGNTLTNDGAMSVGGNDNIFTTMATGTVLQSTPGMLYVDFKPDINPAYRASDTIVLEGTAKLQGTVVASQWTGTVVDAEQDFVILQTTGGVTANGLMLSIEPTPGYTASLVVVGQNLVLRFAAERSTPPAEVDPDWAVAAAMSASGFSDTLIGCPRDTGAYAAIAEGQCLWMDSGGGYVDGDATNGNPGWDQTGWWIGGGGQFALADRFRLGLGVRFEDTSLDQGGDATTSGSLWNAGASLIYTSGPILLAAAASGGRGSLDVRRETEEAVASADHEIDYAHGKLRAGYLFEHGAWYLKPLVDVDATWMSYGDFSEDGGAASGAVKTESEEKTLLSASPRVEIGGDVVLDNGVLLRPFLRVGATLFGETGFDLGWRYVADSPDGPLYEARSELDPVMADVSAGLDVFAAHGLSARLYYDGSFGETIRSHAGGFTARMEF